jgi:hypothetical protein
MKYRYEGMDELEETVIESNIPKEEWGYGTEISISHAERLSEKTYFRNEDGTYPSSEPVIGCDSLNTTNK